MYGKLGKKMDVKKTAMGKAFMAASKPKSKKVMKKKDKK